MDNYSKVFIIFLLKQVLLNKANSSPNSTIVQDNKNFSSTIFPTSSSESTYALQATSNPNTTTSSTQQVIPHTTPTSSRSSFVLHTQVLPLLTSTPTKEISKPSPKPKIHSSSIYHFSSVAANTSKPQSNDDDDDDDDDESEPMLLLYIWQIVIIVAGIVIIMLLVVIGVLYQKNRSLKSKLKIRGSYSIPIKENGTWIDNQDIPLWQKRASTYNVHENPVALKEAGVDGTEQPAKEETSYH